ncbi:LexA family protein [Sodalis ligni]|uniref:LexA DNA binding domain-containing protein n=1 Tax=Sodalis ligni TaxID=2697027 RepID=A0A4R1NR38_9GAMM|nr:hypothetical protein [Sodalis ligni]TCL06870.1 LexA DNA binding domain-containing protein [Sodalis ligni]
MKQSLTKKQTELYEFIKAFIEVRGFPPTVTEMAAHFECFPNSSADQLKALVRKGWIKITPRTSRGLSLIDPVKTIDERALEESVALLNVVMEAYEDARVRIAELETGE